MASGDKSQTSCWLAEGLGRLRSDRAGWLPEQALVHALGGGCLGLHSFGSACAHPAGCELSLCGPSCGFLGLLVAYNVLLQE